MNEEQLNLSEQLDSLRKQLPIDQFNLEEECIKQASLYDEIGQLSSQASAESRKAKNNLEYLLAAKKMEVRNNPEKFGIPGKTTNDAIEDAVTIQEDIRQAKTNYTELSKVADDYAILRAAAEQRKSMIKDLVTLFVHSYYESQLLTGTQNRLGKTTDTEFQNDIANQRAESIHEDEQV